MNLDTAMAAVRVYPHDDYKQYVEPLRNLEKAFCEAGLNVSFTIYTEHDMFMVAIKNGDYVRACCIDGDSPAQAIKDVAVAVRL